MAWTDEGPGVRTISLLGIDGREDPKGVEKPDEDGVLKARTGDAGSESDEMEREPAYGIGGGLLGGEKKSSGRPIGGGKYRPEIVLATDDLGLVRLRLNAPYEVLEERDDPERPLLIICAACLSKDSSLASILWMSRWVIDWLVVEGERDPEWDETWPLLPEVDEAGLLGAPFDAGDIAARLFEDLRAALACPCCSRAIVTFKSMRIEPFLVAVCTDEDTCEGLLTGVKTWSAYRAVEEEECWVGDNGGNGRSVAGWVLWACKGGGAPSIVRMFGTGDCGGESGRKDGTGYPA
jgi:hypothetical protein